ncbi:MAG: TrkA C-terminal domain-containing protein [Bacteroidota bacterium]
MIDFLKNTLAEYPLVLLFVVASLGYLFGTFKIKGNALGLAAVLFTGLAIGAMDERFAIPDIILNMGLALFVYSIGLSSGPAFFKSYKENGIKDFIFIISMLGVAGLVAAALSFIFDFSAAVITGAYAGSSTNTPALAGIIDYIKVAYSEQEGASLIEDSVIGYTFSYPMGVLGAMIAIIICERFLKIDYEKEKKELRRRFPSNEKLSSATVKVSNPEVIGVQLRDLWAKYDWNISMGRIYSNGKVNLVNWSTSFEEGDTVMIVGALEDIKSTIKDIGEKIKSPLSYDRTEFDTRRIFVSNPKVTGQTLASLNLDQKYNAVITRIRRGDVDMIAKGDTVLELGDRIRFIARRKDLRKLSQFFGDSYQAVAKINIFSFGLGIGLGLILGSLEFPISDTYTFKLGYAGGPLIMGLILGAMRRTAGIVWTLPYGATITLQQLGLTLLLAAIGVSSGSAFISSLSMQSFWIFIASIFISLFTAFFGLVIGYKILKKPFSILMGMVSNQPAILDFAMNRSNNRIPLYGFTMIFPIALIIKILIAQILFLVLQ